MAASAPVPIPIFGQLIANVQQRLIDPGEGSLLVRYTGNPQPPGFGVVAVAGGLHKHFFPQFRVAGMLGALEQLVDDLSGFALGDELL